MGIEIVQAFVLSSFGSFVNALPVGFSFGAGMLAVVNPCGFALLPAYISLYLGESSNKEHEPPVFLRVLKSIYISLAVTAGFVVLFGLVGGIIVAGGRFLVSFMPWAGLVVGIGMVVLGIWMLMGKHLYSNLAVRLSAKINGTNRGGLVSYFLFGIAYGVASLSCTLPVFLIVVGTALTGGVAGGFTQFLGFSLGMGVVLGILTIWAALLKGTMAQYMARVLPFVERISAVLILAAGGYVIAYWLTIGGLGQTIRGYF